uniref:F-box domain-containing protein n=1 Tax=Strongyloides papillosus TaxID=174720 RepID=A0A0N5BKK0_STREA
MDLNILSLPPEILAKIFSNIPWNKLINVKLAARDFNYVTKKYHKLMWKPSLFGIFLSNSYNHDDDIDRIIISYSFIKADVDPLEDVSNVKTIILPSSEPNQLHSFLQNFNDIYFLDKMGISFGRHTDVMGIFIDYLHSDFGAYDMYVSAMNCEKDLGTTLSFLQKIKKVENLELDLDFPHLNVPNDFIIPVRNSLESIVIREGEDTAFVNSRMIKYFVGNNSDLRKFKLSLSSLATYRMVIETIVKEELSRSRNNCLHKHISLGLDIPSREAPLELLFYFYSDEFPYNHTNMMLEEYFLYGGNLECPACGRIDSIEIFGDAFE